MPPRSKIFMLDELSQSSNYAIINATRTGNPMLDVILAMLVPLLIAALIHRFEKVKEWVERWLYNEKDDTKFYRSIEHEENYNEYGEAYSKEDDNTDDLMKAINLYINHMFAADYNNGHYKFIDTDPATNSDDEDDDAEGYQNDSRLRRIRDSQILTQPEKNEWVGLTSTLSFRRCTTEQESGSDEKDENGDKKKKERKVKTSMELRSAAEDGKKDVDAFVQAALDWWERDIKSHYRKRRYMYMLQAVENKDDGLCFKKYTLNNYKTFDTIFIPEKENILALIDRFQRQEGKFSIPGFPKQLSILLTGPPGTGKTSLTKAISHYTDRHIIDIPLAKIKTNQDLYDIVFDQRFYSPRCGTDRHKYKRTVFLMEDIDCVSDIVYKRKKDDDKNEDDGLLMTDMIPEVGSEGDGDDKDDFLGANYLKALKKMGGGFKYSLSSDPLTLAGLLNVIDGVIDCPERMLIITTNHPEKLDPALIRPGRINMQLYLGPLAYDEALQMISHYISDFTPAQKQRLKDIFAGVEEGVTAATLEKLCVGYDDVDSILKALEEELAEEIAADEVD